MRLRIVTSCIAVVMLLGLLAGAAIAQTPVTDGLQLHLDAGVGLTLDAQYVTGWADQSGNGHNAYADFGKEPTYTAADVNLNNQPSLDFDGANAILKFSTQVMPDDFTEMTIFSVAQARTAGTGIFTIRTGGVNPLTQLDTQTNGSIRFILRDTDGKTLNANGATSCVGQYGISNGVLSLSEDGLTNTAIARFGGGGGYISSGPTLTPNMADADYYVGGWALTTWNGTIAELLVYDRALTEIEQNDVANYLSTKYGVGWDPLQEPVAPLLDERYGGVNPDNWGTFTAGTGISEMPLEVPYRHARWTLPDPELAAGPDNSAAGVAVAVYTGEETAAEEWENVVASTYIRVGGDSVVDTFSGLAARVQDADLVNGTSGSFYGIYVNPDGSGKIALIRQMGGILGTTDVLLEADLGMEDPVAELASRDLVTKLSVSTTAEGNVQIDGVIATDEGFNDKLAELSFLDDSMYKILGTGSVGFFGLNNGDLFTATNWKYLQVYGVDGAITPPIQVIPGDANKDGVVNDLDATILADNWQSTSANWFMGDFNADGTVDDVDATILATNWQVGATSASVPEPSTIVMLLAAMGSLLLWRRAG